MRLNYIYNTLKEEQKNLTLERVKIGESYNDTYNLTNIQTMLQSLKVIESLDIFKSIKVFKDKYEVLYSWADAIYSSNNNNTSNILNDLKTIRLEIYNIANILEKFIPKEEGYIISVKFPEYESLSDLPRFYKDLDTMLTPLINYFGDDTLTIHSFENGSKWNDYLVQNEVTIKIILTFLSTGILLYTGISQVKRDRLEMDKIRLEMQQIESSEKQDLDIFDKMYEAREEKQYDMHIAKFIQTLEEEKIEINRKGRSEGEIEKIIKHSFKSYQVLINDGTEFYGQLDDEDEDINKLVERLDASQKLLINQKELEFLSEGKVKSLIESTHEEIGASIDTDDEN